MLNLILIILEQSLIYLPLVIGSYISFSLLKVPDLSIESAYVFGAVAGAHMVMYMQGMPHLIVLLLVILASCLGGACVGLVSSLLTREGKLPHLLSSIITSGLFHGINQLVSPVYVSLTNFSNPLFFAGSKQYPEMITFICIGLTLSLLAVFFFKTQLGYAYAMYGNNPHFFAHYGISTSYVFITGVMLANALAGVSGYLFAQSNSFVELNMGQAKALFCITALILGKAIMPPKPLLITIPLLGTGIYFVLQQLLLKVGFNLAYFTAVQALLVAGILCYRYRYTSLHGMQDNLGV